MAARKRTTTRKAKPASGGTRAKSTKSASKPKSTARKGNARRTVDTKRAASPKQLWIIQQLLGNVSGEMSGFAAPTNAAEASAQIRVMSGAKLDATRQTAAKFMDSALKGTAKPPIATKRELQAAAKKVRA